MHSHLAIPKTLHENTHHYKPSHTDSAIQYSGFQTSTYRFFLWKTKQSEIHFLQNTELKKINATMADWATSSINCSRRFMCLKGSHFNSLKDQKYPKQLLSMQFGLQVCMKAHIRTEYCKLSRDLVLSHNVLCYTGNLQSTVH